MLNSFSIFKQKELRRLVIALLLMLTSLLVGFLGYVFIEDYNFIEAFYMSIITISTVGFTEVKPLSEIGRLFTGAYILFNLGIFAYVISIITAYIFEGEFAKVYKRFMTDQIVDKMTAHVIVCGFGRNGIKACEELYNSKKDFLILDNDQSLIEQHANQLPYHFVCGDATQDDTLKRAGIERADSLIITLPNDAENVFITLTARELNRKVKIISRAYEINAQKKLYRAGADEVVMPDLLGGAHMAQIITRPHVIEFLNLLNGIGEKSIALEEITYKSLKPEYHHMNLIDMDIRNRTGATILAFKNDHGDFLFDLPLYETFDTAEVMIILGSEENVALFKDIYCQR